MDESTSQPATPLYYQSSDRIAPMFFIWLPLVGGGGAVALAIIYAFIAYLIHVLGGGPAMVMVAPFFAAALLVLGLSVCRLGQVRMRRARLPIVLLVAAIGLYASWHVYLNFARGDNANIFNPPVPTWTMSPIRLLRAMRELASDRGWGSWLLWLIEAATIFGGICFLMRDSDAEIPFCETCRRWTREIFHVELNDHLVTSAVDELKRGSIEGLRKLGPHKSGAMHYLQVRVLTCTCEECRYACVEGVSIEPGKSGEMRYGSIVPGGRSKLHFKFGSGSSRNASPIITNLAIDDALLEKLETLQHELPKAK